MSRDVRGFLYLEQFRSIPPASWCSQLQCDQKTQCSFSVSAIQKWAWLVSHKHKTWRQGDRELRRRCGFEQVEQHCLQSNHGSKVIKSHDQIHLDGQQAGSDSVGMEPQGSKLKGSEKSGQMSLKKPSDLGGPILRVSKCSWTRHFGRRADSPGELRICFAQISHGFFRWGKRRDFFPSNKKPGKNVRQVPFAKWKPMLLRWIQGLPCRLQAAVGVSCSFQFNGDEQICRIELLAKIT